MSSVKQNPQPTHTVYISYQYCRGSFFLSQVWSLYSRITATQWPNMVPILQCSVHLSPMFKKISSYSQCCQQCMTPSWWWTLCVLPSSVLLAVRIYILSFHFNVFLVLHFMLYAFQCVSALKNTQKNGISEEYLQHVWLSHDLIYTYIYTLRSEYSIFQLLFKVGTSWIQQTSVTTSANLLNRMYWCKDR